MSAQDGQCAEAKQFPGGRPVQLCGRFHPDRLWAGCCRQTHGEVKEDEPVALQQVFPGFQVDSVAHRHPKTPEP